VKQHCGGTVLYYYTGKHAVSQTGSFRRIMRAHYRKGLRQAFIIECIILRLSGIDHYRHLRRDDFELTHIPEIIPAKIVYGADAKKVAREVNTPFLRIFFGF